MNFFNVWILRVLKVAKKNLFCLILKLILLKKFNKTDVVYLENKANGLRTRELIQTIWTVVHLHKHVFGSIAEAL